MVAMDTCVDLINSHADKVDGVKSRCSRRKKRLPCVAGWLLGSVCIPETISTTPNLSLATTGATRMRLLGIFDAIAPAASAALTKLGAGDEAGFM